MVILKAIGIWVVFVFGAIANGTARQYLLAPNLCERTAHQVSSIILSILIFFVVLALIRILGAMNTRRLLGVGLGPLTGRSWEYLLADYNLFQGRLWVLVLATTILAPPVAARLRGTRR